MKPKLIELLGDQPTLVEMKFVKNIANGSAMYSCRVAGKEAVHFERAENPKIDGQVMAVRKGKDVVFMPASAAAPTPPPTPPPTTTQQPAPQPPAIPPAIPLAEVVRIADFVVEKLSSRKELLGDNFASTVNTVLIQCFKNSVIDLSLPPPPSENDLPF